MSDYRVKEFGAIGDGVHEDTKAVQLAIDTCAKEGGGTVLLEQGNFLCCTLYLRSNIRFVVDASASLIALPVPEAYPTNTHYNRYINEPDMNACFLYGEDLENITLEGGGLINGNGPKFPRQGGIARPMMIRLLRCKNVHLRDLRLYHSAAWTTAILDSENIWAEGLDIYAQTNFNGDGLDFDGSKNIFVSNCKIDGSDDNICLQASSRDYPVKNVHISNCTISSICAGIRIGLKSIGDISNVVIDNCIFENIWREGIKIESSEGGRIEGIKASNLIMHNVRRPIYILCNNTIASLGRTEYPEIGSVEGVTIDNLRVTEDEEMKNTHWRFDVDVMGSPIFNGIRVDAEENHKIRDLTLSNFKIQVVGNVKKEEIPENYPVVLDRRYSDDEFCSGNYYPNWSRTAFMDIRNVKDLTLYNIRMRANEKDERIPVIIEKCEQIQEKYMYIDNCGNDTVEVRK